MVVCDEHTHVGWWLAFIAWQVITSHDRLVEMVKARTAKRMLVSDIHCISFLEDEEGSDDTSVSESRQQANF